MLATTNPRQSICDRVLLQKIPHFGACAGLAAIVPWISCGDAPLKRRNEKRKRDRKEGHDGERTHTYRRGSQGVPDWLARLPRDPPREAAATARRHGRRRGGQEGRRGGRGRGPELLGSSQPARPGRWPGLRRRGGWVRLRGRGLHGHAVGRRLRRARLVVSRFGWAMGGASSLPSPTARAASAG